MFDTVHSLPLLSPPPLLPFTSVEPSILPVLFYLACPFLKPPSFSNKNLNISGAIHGAYLYRIPSLLPEA